MESDLAIWGRPFLSGVSSSNAEEELCLQGDDRAEQRQMLVANNAPKDNSSGEVKDNFMADRIARMRFLYLSKRK